jgi:hypothetical protein
MSGTDRQVPGRAAVPGGLAHTSLPLFRRAGGRRNVMVIFASAAYRAMDVPRRPEGVPVVLSVGALIPGGDITARVERRASGATVYVSVQAERVASA